MTGMSETIRSNVQALLRQNNLKQNDLAEALGVSKQVMSNMLSGSRMINAVELRRMAEYFHVSMEKLMTSPADRKEMNAAYAFMGEVKTPAAKRSLEIADEIADMILFYSRVRMNAEELERKWEA